LSKYGLDLGYMSGATMVWEVVAPTVNTPAGALAGVYGGVTGGAAVGIGASANVLIGGSTHAISLQPVSLAGEQGFDVAAGIASITLQYQG
jgi:Protein of unknown function (DUF992)